MFISNTSNYPLGLDISDLSLKFVQLKKSGDKINIQAFGKIDLPPGVIRRGEIHDQQAVIDKINEMTAKPKFGAVTTNAVAACLPEPKTFIKLIKIDKTPNELNTIIGAEIEKHVPITTKETFFDWQIINEAGMSYAVLIGAAPKNIVNQYVNLIKAAKLSVIALEIEPVAICRGLLPEESPKFKGEYVNNYGIIDIGAKRASMVIYSKNTIVMSISMPISGQEITEHIARTLEINNDQAEKAKIICGLDKDKAQGIISNVLSDMIKKLTRKIKSTIEFYESHYPSYGPLNEILICGGGSNIKNIDQAINQAISIPVSIGDIYVNISESGEKFAHNLEETHDLKINFIKKTNNKNLSTKQNTSLSYATAIGLALRSIFMEEI